MNRLTLEGRKSYLLSYEEGDYSIFADIRDEDGCDMITVRFSADGEMIPPEIKLWWEVPSHDIQGIWNPFVNINRCFTYWGYSWLSTAERGSPMCCLFSSGGENRLMFACSDAVNPVKFGFFLREDDVMWDCSSVLFSKPVAPCAGYECTFRVKYDHIRYEDAIGEVVRWWEDMPQYQPMMKPAPECTRPLYSTWYSFHQTVTAPEVERVLKDAASLGFGAVIVDDGWYHDLSYSLYDYCGDWLPSKRKMGDMRAHVERVHSMGIKYYLWYAVSFIGIHSEARERFKGKLLREGDFATVDPRYPDVREYIISTCERALREWDIDGFKLDFIDSFFQPDNEEGCYAPGKDYVSVAQAVRRLMDDMMARLTAIRPNLAVELRQLYVGPQMRKYGNMFRAGDCSNDSVMNKVRTVDVRLCVGDSPAHSDMMTWRPDEPAERAVMQLIGSMFAVPQISIIPAQLPESQRAMLKNWIAFWNAHKSTLLGGRLRAHNPELLYTTVSAETDDEYIAAVYAVNTVAPAPEGTPAHIVIVNGSGSTGIGALLKDGEYSVRIADCLGAVRAELKARGGCNMLEIPLGGMAFIDRD